jgi:putative glycosyltransferase
MLNAVVSKSCPENKTKITIVDDGSSDGTVQFIERMNRSNLQHLSIKLVELSRNFGHHKALLEGVRQFDLNSEFLLLIDSDGEEDPHELPKMMKIMSEEKSDMVVAYVSKRQSKRIPSFFAGIAEIVLNFFIPNKLVNRICTLRLLSKPVVESMINQKFTEPILANIDAEIGFKRSYFQTSKKNKGTSEYSIRKKLKLFFNILFFGSEFIKRMSIALSIFGIFIALIVCSAMIFYRIASSDPLPGFTTTNLLISGFSGLIISLLSSIILLVEKSIEQSRGGTRTVVKRIVVLDD